ncbi:MAG: nicotinate phosphoribosyltransferase [Nitrospirota bacterium]
MTPRPSVLLTDLYQLSMLDVYRRCGMAQTAVFEFFVRKLPSCRRFLVAAGLEQLIEYLESLRFTPEDVEWVRASGRFDPGFADYLRDVRFTGDVHAMPEGTVCFPDEPLVRVTAPMPQAQLVETRLINLIQFQTLLASKAARFALVAPDAFLVDFGLRRAHGAEAGLLGARAVFLAGFSGTATVSADAAFGVPVYGTMAHSFIQAHDDEAQAFANFSRYQSRNVVLLLDTYDTEAAARKVVALAPTLTREGITIKGVRLDSGDLGDHARKVRAILDAGGLTNATIFASGNLDEYAVRDLVTSGAPINGFGVGSRLMTSSDAPYLDCAYKLQEYARRARRKRSEGKATWPGRKQVYRRYDLDGRMIEDLVTLDGDLQDGEPLLAPVMRGGKRLSPPRPLSEIRDYTREQLATLPDALRTLDGDASYPVRVAPAVLALADAVDRVEGVSPPARR